MFSKLFTFRQISSSQSSLSSTSGKQPINTYMSPPSDSVRNAKSTVHQSKHRTLILDLGDVLFYWSTRDLKALTPQAIYAVMQSPTWGQFECGRIGEDEAVTSIGEELSLDHKLIQEGLTQCRGTLHVDHELISQLAELKEEMNGHLKVYAMTNISRDDFARLKAILADWSLFDGEFTSFEAGMRKPELGYYKHVLDRIGLHDPSSAIFVDDKVVNVNAARSSGIQGIVFESSESLLRQLRNQLLDPVSRTR